MTDHFSFVKSTYSTASGECVEVARNLPGVVAVRDSKTPPKPPTPPYSTSPPPPGGSSPPRSDPGDPGDDEVDPRQELLPVVMVP